ncbi:MAG: GGDEF domain-containing protein, partial [Terriglobales bacterium]
MFPVAKRLQYLLCLVFVAVVSLPAWAVQPASAPVLAIPELGKGVAKIDGPWQFHLGDNPAWAMPDAGDDMSNVGWEQISPDQTWGEQGHPAYAGYAWYRKHVHITPAQGASPDFALYITHIEDVYQIYWNGVLVGSHGTMPPHSSYPYIAPPQTFGLGPIRDGVLAIRVWKAPLMSFDPDTLGGLIAAPILGSPAAIAGLKAENDYTWLRSRQYYFGTESLYFLVMVLSLLAWLRNRKQRVLVWMASFSGGYVLVLFLVGLHIPFSIDFALGWLQPALSLIDISIWFLLLYLLDLDENHTLFQFTRRLAIFSFCSASLDGLVTLSWSNPTATHWSQILDAILTVFFTVAEAYPLVLVALAVRKRLDHARWLVAIAAFLAELISVLRIALQQGSRYT